MSATLNGIAVAKGRLQIPAWGRPWADVDLPQPLELARGVSVSLVVADVAHTMAVVSGGALHDKAAYRLVGGAGKWGDTIDEKSYVNDAGVKASLVLSDAAAACGETIADLPATRLGPHYARANDAASAVLNALAHRNWYVDVAGVTRIGARPATTYTGDSARTRTDTNAQIVELATETVAGLVPGVTVDGFGPATDVEYCIEPSRLTVRVWGGPATTSRRINAFEKILRALTARERYAGLYEFRVVTQSGERLNLQPVRTAIGFDDLANVPVRPGVAGFRGDVQLGELVIVGFVDRDGSRPVVISHDAPDSPGWMPLTIEAGGPGALGVARQTDLVVAGPFGGTITTSSVRVKAAL